MSGKEKYERPRGDNLEKWSFGNSGDMPQVWDKDDPDSER
jgi:hypothetical protein